MKRIQLLFLIFCLALSAYSQKKEITVKEYFADAEFFFASEEYADALQEYLEVAKLGYSENANINYHIGVCYLNIPEQKNKAIAHLTKALANASVKYTGSTLNETNAPLDAYLYLGNAYRITYKLDSAISAYNKYISLLPELAREEKNYALKQIESCNIAMEFYSDPQKIRFNNMGSLINNNNENHNCVVSSDGATLIYMTKLPFYEGIFMSKKRGNNWSRPVNITPQIMSDGDQIVTGISSDGNILLLVKVDVFDSDIYIAHFENGEWTKSKPIGKPLNSRFYESHASFSSDAKTIYFTSNKTGGFGEMDIFSSTMQENGNWAEPENLGSNINTSLNEDCPFVTGDGKTLYFCSQGHLNMGGYDFFKASLTDSGWSNPENLRYPLSTTDDDLFYFPYNNGKSGFAQKIFDEGNGSWDIYEIDFEIIEEVIEPIAQETIKEEIKQPDVSEIALVAVAEPVKQQEFELKPVLFGFDAYTIFDDAKPEIGRYVDLLKLNPDITLTISGHTDALGPDNYNLLLSERRAKTVMKYMESMGITAKRIKIIGLGENKFIAINANSDGTDNAEGRRFNRRVEFELNGINPSTLLIKEIDIVPRELKIPGK